MCFAYLARLPAACWAALMDAFHITLISVVAMLTLGPVGLHRHDAYYLVTGVWFIKRQCDHRDRPAVDLGLRHGEYRCVYAAIPLFVLMGFLVAAAGMGRDTYDIGQILLRRVKGGLGMATVLANAIFPRSPAFSVASASIFSKLSVPEMLRHGSARRFAVGTITGSSVLGRVHPPACCSSSMRLSPNSRSVTCSSRDRARTTADGDVLHADIHHGAMVSAHRVCAPRCRCAVCVYGRGGKC